MDVGFISQGGQNSYNIDSVANASAAQAQSKYVANLQNNLGTANSEGNNEPISIKDAKKAVDVVNKLLKDKTTHIEYEQDKDFKNTTIMKVVDNNTKQVINEIPSKKILDMVAQFCEMAGLILNKRA